ncbi:MAG: ATP-binding cassette domain-containing protein [Myxococcota bacterium]
MRSVCLSDVSFSYEGGPVLFENLDLHLTPGWTGVVGPNGGGKSTLLELLGGDLHPTGGRVERTPEALRGALVPQGVEAWSSAVANFAEDWSKSACKTRRRLGLEDIDEARWSSLSPGWKKRWQMACALVTEPDLLLLDEPTNHVDASTHALFVDALRRFDGVGVVVSHDRAFLEALCSRTVRVRDGRVSSYASPYGDARRLWTQEARASAEHRSSRLRAMRATAEQLDQQRRRAEAASRSISARRRMKSAKDADGRSVGRKVRAAQAEAQLSQRARVIRHEAEKARDALSALAPPKREHAGPVWVESERASSRRTLLRWVAPTVTRGDRTVLRGVELDLGPTDRVHLEGANGAGKTTALLALRDEAQLRKRSCLFLPQEHTEAEKERLVANVRALLPDARGRVLQCAARLGFDADRWASVHRVSPGEARKLHLAWAFGQPHHLLLLDEPTNHLDTETIERVEEALLGFSGALVLATHDVHLATQVTSSTWRVDGGRIHAPQR